MKKRGSVAYRYGFNGKEQDGDIDGTGVDYDYGARVYDARVGQFLSTDPLTKKYPELTPYQFASNTPIQAIDLDGKEEYHYVLTIGPDHQHTARLQLLPVKVSTPGFFGFFKSKIPERYIVTIKSIDNPNYEVNYYIGFNSLKGTGNNDQGAIGLAKLVLNQGPSTDVWKNLGTIIEDNFYSETLSDRFVKTGQPNPAIEAWRTYLESGVQNWALGVGKQTPLRYKLGANDQDWRGQGKGFNEALDEAFEKTGVSRDKFRVTKWAKTEYGKSIPVEYQAEGGAEVSVDNPHKADGPDAPHIGWQTPGKRVGGGAARGHIILDAVPAGRSNEK